MLAKGGERACGWVIEPMCLECCVQGLPAWINDPDGGHGCLCGSMIQMTTRREGCLNGSMIQITAKVACADQ